MGCNCSRSADVAESPKPEAYNAKARVLVLFYSTYGHSFQMAKAAAAGVAQSGAAVDLRRIAEVLPAEVLEKMHAVEAQKAFADIPVAVPSELGSYDGVIIVSATRFGSLPTATRTFLDATGQLWMQGQLIGKVGSAMVSTATQHAGQEKSFLPLKNFFLHHGMVVAGLPSSFAEQMQSEKMEGCSPYGATTIAGSDGSRMPSESELRGATFQGEFVGKLALKLAA